MLSDQGEIGRPEVDNRTFSPPFLSHQLYDLCSFHENGQEQHPWKKHEKEKGGHHGD